MYESDVIEFSLRLDCRRKRTAQSATKRKTQKKQGHERCPKTPSGVLKVRAKSQDHFFVNASRLEGGSPVQCSCWLGVLSWPARSQPFKILKV